MEDTLRIIAGAVILAASMAFDFLKHKKSKSTNTL